MKKPGRHWHADILDRLVALGHNPDDLIGMFHHGLNDCLTRDGLLNKIKGKTVALTDKILGHYDLPGFSDFAISLGNEYSDICKDLFAYINRFNKDGNISDRAADVAKTMYFIVGNLSDTFEHYALRTAIATTARYLFKKVHPDLDDGGINDLVTDAKAHAMSDLINKGCKDIAAGITLSDYCDDNANVRTGFLVPCLDMPKG